MTPIELEVAEALERLVEEGKMLKFRNDKGEPVYAPVTPASNKPKLRIVRNGEEENRS